MWYTCLPNSFSSASNTTRFFFRRTNATTTVPRIEPDFPCILRIYLNLREHGAGGLSDHGRPLHFRAEGILRRESAHVLTPQVYVFVSLHLAVHLVEYRMSTTTPTPASFLRVTDTVALTEEYALDTNLTARTKAAHAQPLTKHHKSKL